MRKLRWGFTLVELIVVIATIGILATIAVIGLSRYQADTRDARRASSISVISEALEKYYDNNGEYPSCSSIKSSATTVVTSTLVGIDKTALVAPQADTTPSANSLQCTSDGALLTANGTDFFEYTGDNSVACNTNISCLQYTLKYKEEATGAVKTVTSRRNTSISTSGASTLSASNISFASVDLSWTDVSNATKYTLQQSTNASFPQDVSTITTADINGTSQSVSGLTSNTSYFFRVRSDAVGSTGNWSNTLPVTTLLLSNPTGCVATANSSSQITANCNTVANASTYDVRYSLDSTFGSGVTSFTGLASPTKVVTGLAVGTQYFFQMRAVAPTVTGSWSSTFNATTIVPVPTCTASTVNSNTQITVSWNTVAVATSYTLQYATNSGFTGATTVSGIVTTSKAIPGLNNGTTYYFKVAALNGSTSSLYGACPSATTGVNGPSSVGWSAEAYMVRARAGLPWMPGADPGYGSTFYTNGMYITGTCSPGATVVTRLYSYYAYSNNTSPNNATLMDWTWGTQDRYVVGGSGSWQVWWQGWVACQVGGTRAGDTYLGNAGPY
ncbi:MAG: fibronectin type III domain-containing protein [Candidatus Saccharimonadales bacterium]